MTKTEKAELVKRLEADLLRLGTPSEEAVREAEASVARLEKRLAWLNEQLAKMEALHDRIGAYWCDWFERHPGVDPDDPAVELPEPSEARLLRRIERSLDAVREQDRWPRHLYFGGM